ncbi:hypothetical protein L227DRAFT_571050 [Lentinus tigrinus ALCF2SS1-6]|uniref:F-box domain-containing protein n=1 Tax=Lentinus tigrinus ALCF2SS1-6 TaxID=1328759 RepID=A0A5C2STB7_9APHY|nr:hypothetical protein L227DRAFT_571050 [Lentinus tigrinus ALCF2SS1-6]
MSTSITMNLDVLLAIMGFVVAMPADIAPHPSCTIASMMRANRALYHEGAKVLLSGEVRLGTEKPRNVSSFAECCLAENGIRLAYVRRLVLTARFYTTTSPAALSTLLPKFPNLISLSLLGWTESLFEGSEGEVFFSAVASLTTLSRLEVREGAAEYWGVLHQLRSPLRELVWVCREGLDPKQSFFFRLSHYAPTLETLHLAGIDLFYERRRLEPRFLKVSHLILDITKLHAASFDISDLLVACPNIKRLTTTTASHSFTKYYHRYNAFEYARRHNRKTAARDDRSAWASLMEVRTDVVTAWAFGLSCKVERLWLQLHHHNDIERPLPEVLADLRPTTLYLEFHMTGPFREPLHSPAVRRALVQAARNHPPELTVVDVGLYVDIGSVDADLQNVLQAFAGLKVESFRLIILGFDDPRHGSVAATKDDTTLAALRVLNPKAIVQDILSANPCVHKASFEVRDLPEYSADIDLDAVSDV